MRVKVIGQGAAAKALRGHLGGFSSVAVVESLPDFTVDLRDTHFLESCPVVDGVEGPLELHVVNELAISCGMVIIKREGGNQSEDMLVVSIPPHLEAPAGRAIFRALTGRMIGVKRGWWRRRLW